MTSLFLRGQGVDPFPGESTIPHEKLEELEAWLQDARLGLGMAHYRVSVSAGNPRGSESTAETFARDASNELVIAFADSFFAWPELHRRGVLLHELLHGPTHQMSIFARDNCEDELGERAFAIYQSALGDLEERFVDTLGHALAPRFPESPKAP